MNGILNSGLNFWQFIIAIFTAVFSFVAIKISFNFDLNRYLETRCASYTQKLKNACTHVQLKPSIDGQIQGQSLYVSPPGTIEWQCQRCGHVAQSMGDEFQEQVSYYLENIDAYHKKNRRFSKLLKKSGQV